MSVEAGQAADGMNLPEGVTIKDMMKSMSFDGSGQVALTFVLQLGSAVTSGILAHWLYNTFFRSKWSSLNKKITIQERVEAFATEKDLHLIIEREIRASLPPDSQHANSTS
ncbi:MAG: hypothetical protein ABSB30_13055 [Terracidiphilus sp.]|jgi:hypothetical protein